MSYFRSTQFPTLMLSAVVDILKKTDLIKNYDKNLRKNKNFFFIFLKSQDIDYFDNNINIQNKINYIYLARSGHHFDGHTLAQKVLNSGNFLIGNPEKIVLLEKKGIFSSQEGEKILSHLHFIGVQDVERAINILLEQAYQIDKNQFQTIAVTGTNGKTSVTQICAGLLEFLYQQKVLKIGTLGIQLGEKMIPGSHVTMPDYPLFLQAVAEAKRYNVNKIVIESTSHGLKEGRFGNWEVDVAIFTNLTQDHLDYHKNIENYMNSKLRLFHEYLKPDGVAIICTTVTGWEVFAHQAQGLRRTLIGVGSSCLAEEFFFKFKNSFKDLIYLSVSNKKLSLEGIQGTIKLHHSSGASQKKRFFVPLIGEFQFDNTLCAIAAILSFGFSLQEIVQKALKGVLPIPGRLERVEPQGPHIHKLRNLPTVLIDYAHTPDALEKAIKICKLILAQRQQGKLLTVFGCGGDRDKDKRPLMGKLACELSDVVIVTSDNPRSEDPLKIIEEICVVDAAHCFREADRKKAIELAIKLGKKFDLILIAGKGHEDYQIIGDLKYPFSDAKIASQALFKEKN